MPHIRIALTLPAVKSGERSTVLRPGQIYVFGDFRLDVSRRELTPRAGGAPIPLSAQSLELLFALLHRPAELVERSVLLAEVWPNVLVVDNALSQAVAALRRALGDDPDAPRYIETVARRGYRLIADVADEGRTERDPQAYQLYVVGWSALTRPDGVRLGDAVRAFEAAVARDPDFALAHAALTEAYALLIIHGIEAAGTAMPRMRMAIERAMALAPGQPEVHAAFGMMIQLTELDWRAAARCYMRAIEMNPNCYQGLRYLGMYRMQCGRFDEAIDLFRRCQTIQPLAVNLSGHIGMAHYFAGNYGAAIHQLELTLQMESTFEVSRSFLGRCYLRLGDIDRAMAEFARMPSTVHARASDMPVVLAMSGRAEEARSWLPRLVAAGRPFDVAAVHAALGESGAAMDWLEKAAEARVVGFFAVEPLFAAFRETTRFQELLRRLGIDAAPPRRAI